MVTLMPSYERGLYRDFQQLESREVNLYVCIYVCIQREKNREALVSREGVRGENFGYSLSLYFDPTL